MQNWLAQEVRAYRRVSVRMLLYKFMARPCGWSELDVLGVMAELVNKGKAELRVARVRDRHDNIEDYTEDVQKLLKFFTTQLFVFLKARADLA